eukprot:scaffold66856_cov29-Tisochrysis_lutea.AAC.1
MRKVRCRENLLRELESSSIMSIGAISNPYCSYRAAHISLLTVATISLPLSPGLDEMPQSAVPPPEARACGYHKFALAAEGDLYSPYLLALRLRLSHRRLLLQVHTPPVLLSGAPAAYGGHRRLRARRAAARGGLPVVGATGAAAKSTARPLRCADGGERRPAAAGRLH